MSQRYLGGVITANPTTPTMTNESGVWTLEQQFQYTTTWSPKIVGNSLRFRSSATAYLSRTPASASNQKTFTWSGWVKRGILGVEQNIFGAGPDSSNKVDFRFDSSNALRIFCINSGTTVCDYSTSAVFRDPSAWYHVVLSYNASATTLAIYVNGVSQSLTTATAIQNTNTYVNSTSLQFISSDNVRAKPHDGYMAEIYFVDGQALTPSSFGAFDSTGVWQPLPYTGTYGTNGFYLTFADNSAATAAALGKDYSGNGNNWTPNNISLTAGTTYDWMLDSPTNYPGTSTGVGNYCTWNPLQVLAGSTLDGNLNVDTTNSIGSTFAVSSGKWYFETTPIYLGASDWYNIGIFNIATAFTASTARGASSASYVYRSDGFKRNNGTAVSYGTSYTTGDIIGVALDLDGGTLTFYKNGTSQGTAYTGLSGTFMFEIGGPGGQIKGATNFGQRPFTYTPPTGFLALNTQNLPVPTITNGANYFAASTYTGNGSTQSITNGGNNTTGVTFKPDLVWTKSRSNAYYNYLNDSVRGAGLAITSNATDAEINDTAYFTAFTANGFNLAGGIGAFNASTYTYVAWQWQAGQGTTSSNTSGSITSTVSVNATAGFSVVTYTEPSGTFSFGHGLGVAPAMFIIKARGAVSNWIVWHKSLPAPPTTSAIYLNSTGAVTNSGSNWLTSVTSSIIQIVDGQFTSTGTQVAYCWAEVAGFSKFGSYTGNGSTDGPFVYLGFRPRWIMTKRTDSGGGWNVSDTSRDTYNVAGLNLAPESANAETSGNTKYDITANGFKIRSSTFENVSGGTYIYAAFAENPFKISRAR